MNNKKTKGLVVVTGATGHVGANLCRLLLSKGYAVRGLHKNPKRAIALKGLDMEIKCGEITDKDFIKEALKGADIVVHSAAKISIEGDKDGSVQRTNLEGPRLIANACLEMKVKKLVHISSIHMFDLYKVAGEVNEDSPASHKESFAYDYSKRLGYQAVCDAYKKGLDVSVLCPVGVIGPHDYVPSLMGKFFTDLYNKKLPALVEGGFFWIDVRDLCEGVLSAISRGKAGEAYILSGHYAKIATLAKIVSEVTDRKIRIPSLPYAFALLGLPFLGGFSKLTGAPPLYTYESIKVLHKTPASVSYAKAQKDLGYSPRPLEETIRDTYEWYFNEGILTR